jgi:thiamine pyrophosphate-dependent acetolactate synthase large subunit-like protein
VGFDPVELIKPWSVDAPVVHIDTVPNIDQVYPAAIEIVGALPAVLSWLAAGFRGEPKWSEAAVGRHRDTLRRRYYAGRVEGRLNPTDVIDAVRTAAPRDALVTTDVGSHKLLVGQGWTTYEPRTSLMSNGLSSMGFSLPAAIGAKLVRPERPVVCILGDGGFAMVQGELRLAASLGLGMAVVVLCDQSLNRIELKQLHLGYPSTATRIEDTDLVLWHVVGAHHPARPEDWPVMPATSVGFTLQPVGFFDGNPGNNGAPTGADGVRSDASISVEIDPYAAEDTSLADIERHLTALFRAASIPEPAKRQ